MIWKDEKDDGIGCLFLLFALAMGLMFKLVGEAHHELRERVDKLEKVMESKK